MLSDFSSLFAQPPTVRWIAACLILVELSSDFAQHLLLMVVSVPWCFALSGPFTVLIPGKYDELLVYLRSKFKGLFSVLASLGILVSMMLLDGCSFFFWNWLCQRFSWWWPSVLALGLLCRETDLTFKTALEFAW